MVIKKMLGMDAEDMQVILLNLYAHLTGYTKGTVRARVRLGGHEGAFEAYRQIYYENMCIT